MSRRGATRSPPKTSQYDEVVAAREKAWDNRVTPTNKLQPYSAVEDPYCPITKTSRFKKHLLGVLHREEEQGAMRGGGQAGEGPGGLGWMLESSMRPGEHSRREIRELENRMSRNLSTASGGITMAFEVDEEEEDQGGEELVMGQAPTRIRELDVLKNVVLREEYIQRLHVLVRQIRRKVPDSLSSLLDLIRISSVETVESIAKWREARGGGGAGGKKTTTSTSTTTSPPFMWNGVNYLLKMSSDLDFLDGHRGIRFWLGYSAYRNPFIVPLPLEQLPAHQPPPRGAGPVQQGNQQGEEGQQRGPDLAHFQSRDFNAVGGEAGAEDMELPIRLKRKGVDVPRMLGAIGDLDMIRVRAAEKLLLAEEAATFRFVRNAEGRAVPASLASAEALKLVLQGDQGRDVRLPATAHPYASPLADVAGVGRVERDDEEGEDHNNNGSQGNYGGQGGGGGRRRSSGGGGKGREAMSEEERRLAVELAKAARGKVNARKEGGALGKLRTAGTAGRKRGRILPSRGASLDNTTIKMRTDLYRFQETLQGLRQRLAAAKAELTGMEQPPPTPTAASSPPSPHHHPRSSPPRNTRRPSSAAGGGGGPSSPNGGGGSSSARRSLSARPSAVVDAKREEVRGLSEEVRRGEEELQRKSSRLEKRESTMDKLKEAQRTKTTKDSALNVERKRRLLDPKALDLPEDADSNQTLEDMAATHIQRVARGRIARNFTSKMRKNMFLLATVMQKIIRGFVMRQRYRRTVETNKKVSKVQAIQRGRLGRRKAVEAAEERRRQAASLLVSKLVVGYYGRRRFLLRLRYLQAGKECAAVVGPMQLFNSDVNDLAKRIERFLLNPGLNPVPPVILGLLRVVILMLGGDLVTVISATGASVPKPMNYAGDIDWIDALRVLRRTAKFLRRLRVVASGPAARRPRLVHVPQRAMELYVAYKADPQWSLVVVRTIGQGALCAAQLLSWVEAVMVVNTLQRSFLNDIGGVEPDWLVRHRDFCKARRELGLQILERERYCSFLQAAIERDAESERFLPPRVRALEVEQLVVQDLRKKMQHMEAVEQEQKDREVEAELLEIKHIREELAALKKSIEVKTLEYIEAEDKARKGNKVQEARLPQLLQELSAMDLDLRETRVSLQMRIVLHERAVKYRREEMRYDGTVTSRCANVGEAEGALCMFAKDADVLRQSISDHRHKLVEAKGAAQKDLEVRLRRDQEELEIVLHRLDAVRPKSMGARTALAAAVSEFEEELRRRLEQEKTHESAGLSQEWNLPSRDEVLEDQREDERLAREEVEMMAQWVPKDVLTSKTFPGARPVLICVSRDVPEFAKQRIFNTITSDLTGVFIRMRTSEGLGLDIPKLQSIITAGCSVVADVDAGLCVSTRRRFLDALMIAKRALTPSPQVVLLLGNPDNPGMDGLTGEKRHFGLCDEDLTVMVDQPIKRRLHIAAECMSVLTSGRYRSLIEGLARREKPPAVRYILVMEAMAILFTPQGTFRSPAKNHSAASWFTVKRSTAPYESFCERVCGVDKAHIPPENLLILEEYIEHANWPKAGEDLIRDVDPVLWYFTTWTQSIVELAVLYRNGEGPAPMPDRRTPEGLFSGVVKVSSAETELREEDEAAGSKGWRAAYAFLMSYVLEDCRCMREGRKLNDQIYTVSVYQMGNRLFFNAYNPQTSTYRHTSLLLSEVSALLSPSSFQPQQDAHWNEPPKTHLAVCQRLVTLLCVQNISKAFGDIKHMVCRRKLQRLLRQGCKISGHQVLLSLFEESKGELRCVAYLPQYSVMINLLVNAANLSACVPNLDRELETGVDSEDIRERMLPIAERLAITPSWTAVEDMGYLPPSQRVVTSLRSVMHRDDSQGFRLRLRRRSGPGHRLFRYVTKVSGRGLFAIGAMEAGKRGTLRLRIYNHQTCGEQEMRLNPVERACLLGSTGGSEWREWRPKLLHRLKLRARSAQEAEEGRRSEEEAMLREEVVLDRKVYAKLFKGEGGLLYRLSVFIEKRGASLLLEFRVGNRKDRYTKTLSWNDLLAANGVQLEKHTLPSEDLAAMQAYVCQLSHQDRHSLLDSITRGGVQYNETNDEIHLGPAFNGMVVRNWKVGGDDFRVNTSQAYKDNAVGTYFIKKSTTSSGKKKRRRTEPNITLLTELVDYVTSERCQAGVVVYDHEIGQDVPVAYWPQAARPRTAEASKQQAGGGVAGHEAVVEKKSQPGVARPASPAATIGSIATTSTGTYTDEETAAARGVKRGCLGEDGPEDGERVIFNQGIKVLHELHRVKTWYSSVNLRVFASYPNALSSSSSGDGGGGGDEGAMTRTLPTVTGVDDETPAITGKRRLRLVVYRVTSSAYSEISINGIEELREVVGLARQDLLAPNEEEEMLRYIAHSRLTVMEGLWNSETDQYEPMQDDSFTLLLRKDRLYSTEKATPLHLGGEADEEYNKRKLINDRISRGRKILRCARNVQGTFLHFTVFEIGEPEPEEDSSASSAGGLKRGDSNIAKKDLAQLQEEEPERMRIRPHRVPKLRFVSFDPLSGQKSIALPSRDAILETVGGQFSPFLEPARRSELARALVNHMVLKRRKETTDNAVADHQSSTSVACNRDIVLPWSGDQEVRMLKGVQAKVPTDPATAAALEEMMLYLPGRLIQMGLHIEDLHVQVTVFRVGQKQEPLKGGGGGGGASSSSSGDTVGVGDSLRINFYCAKIGDNQDVVLTTPDQIDLVGRPIFELTDNPLNVALRKLVDKMEVSIVEEEEREERRRSSSDSTTIVSSSGALQSSSSEGGSSRRKGGPSPTRRRRLQINPFASRNKPWLRAYQLCNAKEITLKDRARGQPLVFIPSTLKGDLLWRRGVKISHTKCLLTVSTKAKGLTASHGLIFEAYDPLTCTNATLHVGRTELLREVNEKEDLLSAETVRETIEALLYRLKLVRHPVQGIVLELDIKINPNLFRFIL